MKNFNQTNKVHSFSELKTQKDMFSVMNAFRDSIRTEPMVSLGNSFELLVLVSRLG